MTPVRAALAGFLQRVEIRRFGLLDYADFSRPMSGRVVHDGIVREVTTMPEVDVQEAVRNIVVEKLDRKPEEVTMDAKFTDDLGADSLDLTELLMALEEEYNIEIDDEANEIQTVGDAVEYIKGKLDEKS
jgi:acyl carrier protein